MYYTGIEGEKVVETRSSLAETLYLTLHGELALIQPVAFINNIALAQSTI